MQEQVAGSARPEAYSVPLAKDLFDNGRIVDEGTVARLGVKDKQAVLGAGVGPDGLTPWPSPG
jgi:hypothetical protein